ncbi:hypothetical protein FA15DRAFT_672557 [Coprinopsis marcescibilis]|uniref:Uncharacterized protein n=1 Tax=Coprinopsis marcescibilis TaxID=230819 RepID=A0A5C3KNI5_COPMA|nr:hypothetical protein FA15DRAFT_672557 [Coprinopsis marcescibilis]
MQPYNPLEPSQSSLEHRNRLSNLITSLRRVRPRVPFWQLAAHRLPTLWGLYRGLLKTAPHDQIRWRVRKIFQKNQHLTGTGKTIECLNLGYKYLDAFKRASNGDLKTQAVLARYARLIDVKRESEHWKQVLREELEWQERLRNKPRLTGSLQRSTLDNRPLPRLSPQPEHFAQMFIRRRRTRENRLKRQRRNYELVQDIQHETNFERNLLRTVGDRRLQPVFEGSYDQWIEPLQQDLENINRSHELDRVRLATPVSPELVATLSAARRYKIENKTREKDRERRGVELARTIRRKRQGPPAHILCKMSEKEKEIDRIIRSPSEGGYVAQVKLAAGMKLKTGDKWKKEIEASPKAKIREERILRENEKRAKMTDTTT